jgi:solute carrier family 26 (sodium-independent sulfate anion transporter), member 11
MALLTGEIVTDFVKQGYPAYQIATAVAFMTGVYSMAIGLLKLGFLLDFIPLPVLSGYVSAAALTIVIGQIPTLFGEKNLGSSTGDIIHDFFQKLPKTQWRDFLVGFSGLLVLFLMQYMGRKWGKQNRAIWFLSISRNALVLILFTGISYGVNKGRKVELFAISKTVGSGIKTPSVPNTTLIGKVAARSVAVFVAAALEHLAIGKSFGRRHNYAIDQSQELTFIGVANFLGSFFSAMPITGGFSRTAVNSESGVKSPLNGVVTAACVLVSIYKLTDAFYWIPKATLSAIIITAVWQIILPPKVFYGYWQTSFADFVTSMVSFWVTLFVSVEIGIAAAVGCSIVYLLLRLAFSRATLVTQDNFSVLYPGSGNQALEHGELPEDGRLFKLNESILFPNAFRIKSSIIDAIRKHNSGLPAQDVPHSERLWNVKKRSATLENESTLPRLRTVILDFTNVNHIDTTGVQAFVDLKSELQAFAGDELELRFAGMNLSVRKRFERAHWQLRSAEEGEDQSVRDGGDIVFDVVQTAIIRRDARKRTPSSDGEDIDIEAASENPESMR